MVFSEKLETVKKDGNLSFLRQVIGTVLPYYNHIDI
jgi:hypothetical protein